MHGSNEINRLIDWAYESNGWLVTYIGLIDSINQSRTILVRSSKRVLFFVFHVVFCVPRAASDWCSYQQCLLCRVPASKLHGEAGGNCSRVVSGGSERLADQCGSCS